MSSEQWNMFEVFGESDEWLLSNKMTTKRHVQHGKLKKEMKLALY